MDYEGFKKEILSMAGLDLSAYKEKQMKRRIDSLIAKNNFASYDLYVKGLRTSKELFNNFINYLTINVSEFYRNPERWQVLEKEILPAIMKTSRIPKIWSSACSTGDEPYTLVMILSKLMPLSSIKVIASDIDQGALDKAKSGIYSIKSLEKLPKEFVEKYFIKDNISYTIKDEVKKCIEFKKINLLKDEYPRDCDLIVCRNVLIYFTEEAKDGIYKKFSNSMKKGGYLFIGSTEQILNSQDYHFKTNKTFFYIKE